MISKQLDGDLIVQITKPIIVGFASLLALGAYIVHPILLIAAIFVFVSASA